MPQRIQTNSLSGLRPVFNDNLENYKRYIQLRKKFEDEYGYRIFAEPKVDSSKTEASWFTDWEGPILTFDQYLISNPAITREELESYLKIEINRLFAECESYKDTDAEYFSLSKTLDQCIEVPGYNDIHLVLVPEGGYKFVLTNWGFIEEKFNALTGIIRKMKIFSVLTLRARFRYLNESVAANEVVFAEFNSQTREYNTDANGEIILEKFLTESSLSVYQKTDDDMKVNVVNFPSVNTDLIHVTIRNLKVADLLFKVQNNTGTPLAGKNIIFTIDGKELHETSNHKGLILLSEIPFGAKVECFNIANTKDAKLKSLICTPKEIEHTLHIADSTYQPATPKDVTLHFIDKHKKDIPDLDVSLINAAGESRIYRTDNAGKFILDHPESDKKYKLKATHNGKPWKGTLKTSKDKDYHMFVLKKRSRWWLWLLLGLLLILAVLLAWWLYRRYYVPPQPENTEVTDQVNNTQVKVVDYTTGNPISGAKVKVDCGNYSHEYTTDASGRIKFNGVPTPSESNKLLIYATASNYGDERREYSKATPEIVIKMKKISDGGLVGKRGQISVTLQWSSKDDLDLAISDPCSNTIYYQDKTAVCSSKTGELDVDANYRSDQLLSNPQENIVWKEAPKGSYNVYVIFYAFRENITVAFKLTIVNGNDQNVIWKTIEYDGKRNPVLFHTINF